MIKKRTIFFIIFSIILLGCSQDNISTADPKEEAKEKSAEMVIIADVPSNTPEEDIIYFEKYDANGIGSYKMDKIEPFKHKISFPIDKLELEYDDSDKGYFRYRYNRNNLNYITSESYGQDSFEHAEYSLERKIMIKPKGIQVDNVERWRWFPNTSVPIARTTKLEPRLDKFTKRINNLEFRSGHMLQDLYLPAFDDFFDSTARHMKEQGYTWVVIAPPWDWVEKDPLPKVGNPVDNNPNYPDEKLINHIEAFKNAGLKVQLSPQICCTSVDTEGRSKEWLRAYSKEVEIFMLHHAKIAEQTNVDAFLFDVTPDDGAGFDNPDARLLELLNSVKKEFSGEIGTSATILMLDENMNPEGLIPQPGFFKFADEIDFFVLSSNPRLSLSDYPTDEMLKIGAGEILDIGKPLYDAYQKPVIMQTSYASLEKSWKGATTVDFVESMNTPWFPERQSKYEFSGGDQARVFNAFFEAAAERPWIIGLINFGYWHWEMPTAPDMSVRGKPAEDLWRKWNRVIYTDDKEDSIMEEFRRNAEIPTENEREKLPDCENRFFTTTPVDLSDVNEITPLGNIGPPGHTFPTDHTYLHLGEYETNYAYPLYAPADVHITSVQWGKGMTQDPIDYTIYFALCRDVIGYYNHVKSISSEIKKITDKVECEDYTVQAENSCTKVLLEKVEEGTLLGEVGLKQGNFDFGLIDLRKELEFANKKRYPTRTRYIKCAYDYYKEDMRKQFFDLIKRNDPQKCGITMQDIPGTLKGNWFHESADEEYVIDWNTYLAFVNDNDFSEVQIVSVAGIFTDPGKFKFIPKNSGKINREFSQVSADEDIYCYEAENAGKSFETVPSGKILVQLESNTKLKIEYQGGKCDRSEMFNKPEVYNR
jgi:hypothetical protein